MIIQKRILPSLAAAASLAALGAGLSGCGSAYSGLASGSGLGAAEYQPAVVVEPGNEARYQQVLAICRTVAAKRQATAAQKAQLETLTGAVSGVAGGAAQGATMGNLLGNLGYDSSASEGATIGAAAGLVTGLAGAFAKGANRTADETRRILLNCLKETSRGGKLWKVVE